MRPSSAAEYWERQFRGPGVNQCASSCVSLSVTEPRAAAEVCGELLPRLVGSLVLYCGDRLVAEELAQEAMARAWERWDRVGVMASPEAWIHRVAFNLARSWFRRRGAERRAMQRVSGAAAPPPLPDIASAVAVRDAVAALPGRQRAVVIARFYGGLSVKETATVLGCSPGAVKTHTSRALSRLRASGLGDLEEVTVHA